jgi:thiosulfate/3-mercaptopyruvate sulfurtransferase
VPAGTPVRCLKAGGDETVENPGASDAQNSGSSLADRVAVSGPEQWIQLRYMRRMMLFCLAAGILLAADPWADSEVVAPDALAKDLNGRLVIYVGFNVLYRAAHIAGTIYAGPASQPEGIAELKKAVAGEPRDRDIVLYCGCCPMEKCPNIRPAFAMLHEMGFTRVRVLGVPANLKTDWIDKGYPTDKRSE